MKKMAEMMSILNSCTSSSSSCEIARLKVCCSKFACHNISLLVEEILEQVLLRLPIRDVYRAKCVCKEWRSIISSPEFIKAYYSGAKHEDPSRGLLIATTDGESKDLVFYYSSLYEHEQQQHIGHGRRVFIPRLRFSYSDYQGMTQVVNGLVCLYSSNRLSLVDICTRETIDLPLAPSPPPDVTSGPSVEYYNYYRHKRVTMPNEGCFWAGEADEARYCSATRYYFGFDTLHKVYKVLSLSYMCREGCPGLGNSCQCRRMVIPQILSLSGPVSSYKWRKVPHPFPHFEAMKQAFCVDGQLWWIVCQNPGEPHPVHIPILFDLACEAFDFVGQGVVPTDEFWQRCRPSEYGGRLALLDCSSSFSRRLRFFTYDSIMGPHMWGKHTIYLSVGFMAGKSLHDITPVENSLSGGDTLIANSQAHESFTPVISYNHEHRRFKLFQVGKFPPQVAAISITFLEEDLTPLHLLIGSGLHH